MEISGLLSLLPPEFLPIGVLALIALYIFRAVMPFFRKSKDSPEDTNKTDAIG